MLNVDHCLSSFLSVSTNFSVCRGFRFFLESYLFFPLPIRVMFPPVSLHFFDTKNLYTAVSPSTSCMWENPREMLPPPCTQLAAGQDPPTAPQGVGDRGCSASLCSGGATFRSPVLSTPPPSQEPGPCDGQGPSKKSPLTKTKVQ